MATRGPKPKAARLRLVTGTHRPTRHGDWNRTRKEAHAALTGFGALTRPADLKGEGRKAWDKWIEPAGWLDRSQEPAAIAFCLLWQEFQFAPTAFPAAKHGQMRVYMAELGLTDERARKATEDDDHQDDLFT